MREDVIQKLRRMIYDGTGVPAHLALITLDVAEAAEKERRRLVEDGCDLLHDHHADCIDAEMVEADRCDRCRRLDGLDTVLARLEEAGT